MSHLRRLLRITPRAAAEGRYWLNPETVIWPLRRICINDQPIDAPLVAITGPLRTAAERDALTAFVADGYRLLGVSSYQNFPQRLVNPHEYTAASQFSFFEEFGDRCVGWVHCFRKPAAFLPRRLPRIFLAESDFTDPCRIRPGRVDHIEFDLHKRYDFAYLCGAGPWNEFCRNWPLARACISKMLARGLHVAVFGRDQLDQLDGAAGLSVFPQLPWHEFIPALAQCRHLFVPNVYDASPRIMAEALCLNMPLLVNRQILGGWHYVERPSGVFFSDIDDFDAALDKLLRRRFQPREYYRRLFGPEYAGDRLRRFVTKLLPRL